MARSRPSRRPPTDPWAPGVGPVLITCSVSEVDEDGVPDVISGRPTFAG